MANSQSSRKKLCFVIGPIGADDSDVRVHADWLLDAIITPVMLQFPDFSVERADKLSQPGLIDAQVINKLLTAELCIADLSLLNPNAFYEIGIRHMAQRPIIHMHHAGEQIPFDVSLYRSIKFSRRTPSDLKVAQEELAKSVLAVLAPGYEVENPITNVRGRLKLEEGATAEEKVFIDRLTALEERLARTEASTGVLTSPPNPTIILDIQKNEDEWSQFTEQQVKQLHDWFGRLFDTPSFVDARRRFRVEMPNNPKNRKAVQHFRTLSPNMAGVLSVDIY